MTSEADRVRVLRWADAEAKRVVADGDEQALLAALERAGFPDVSTTVAAALRAASTSRR